VHNYPLRACIKYFLSADVISAHLTVQLLEPRVSGYSSAEVVAAGEMAHEPTPKDAAPGLSRQASGSQYFTLAVGAVGEESGCLALHEQRPHGVREPPRFRRR